MVSGSFAKVAKWLLFSSSICYVVFGVALTITAAVLLGYSWTRKIIKVASFNEEDEYTEITDILAIVIGICMAASSVLAIVACWIEDRTLYLVHMILGVVVALLELCLVVIALVNNSRLGDSLRDGMRTFLDAEYDGGNSEDSRNWNSVQVYLECCGVGSRGDYLTSDWLDSISPVDGRWRWPRTCCTLVSRDATNPIPENEEACRQGSINQYYHTQGCHDAVRDWVTTQGSAFSAVNIVFIVMEILMIVLDIILYKDDKDNEVAPLF